MSAELTDIESLRTLLSTYGLQGPTLDMAPDATFSLKESGPQLELRALHTLPELHFDGQAPLGKAADLRELGTLGQGGMGVVRLANQLSIDRDVAVKTTRQGVGEEAAQALLKEAYVTGYLEHPNIVPIYTVGRNADGAPLIVMKRVEGISWHELLTRERQESGDAIDLTRHVEILVQVCNAIRYAHSRRIVHRDLKPDNVMIGHFGEVYVLDWGIAVCLDEGRRLLPSRSQIRGVSGTPGYMAPEMAHQNIDEQDELTDVYLLGATLHHVLTGEPRHLGPTVLAVLFGATQSVPCEYDASVPDELGAIANKACHPDRQRRYESVEAFRQSLLAYLEHRESIALSMAADVKRADLETFAQASPPDLSALHDAYGECRFGYEQALRMWPQNVAARHGLQRCLETMIEHYLREGNTEGAQTSLAALPEPRPELAARVAQLVQRQSADVAEFARLKAMAQNLDLRRGRRGRVWLAAILGLFWTYSGLRYAIDADLSPMANSEALWSTTMAGFRNLVLAVLALMFFRKQIFSNVANSRLGFLLLATLAIGTFTRWAGWHMEASTEYVYAIDPIIYTLAILAAGMMTDRRISWLSAFFGVAAVFGVLFPALQLYGHALATTCFFAGLIWLWRS
jgi:eukaryotic-like serine/threonine-protein kinase